MATLPERVALLERVVAAILPQVDHLNVFLDGHVVVPACVQQPRVTVVHARDYGALHGSGKFLWGTTPGYHLTVDDDLLYPADYVAKMLAAVDRYEQCALVCVLGRRFLVPNPSGFFTAPMMAFSADRALDIDLDVHTPGTGTAAWHTSTFLMAPSPQPFQDDMHMALTARRQSVRVIAIARPDAWLSTQPVAGFTTAKMPGKIEGLDALLRANAPWPALPLPNDQQRADVIRRHWS
jgi:hypothetical protein